MKSQVIYLLDKNCLQKKYDEPSPSYPIIVSPIFSYDDDKEYWNQCTKLIQTDNDDYSCVVCFHTIPKLRILPCGCSICGRCIRCWLKVSSKNPTCPTCRNKIVKHDNIDDYPLNITLNKLISNKIRCKCPNDQCEHIDQFETIESHYKNCVYTIYKCNNCSKTGDYNSILKHCNIECQYRTIKCDQCDKRVRFVQNNIHIDRTEPQTLSATEDTQTKSSNNSVDFHKKYECYEREIQCSFCKNNVITKNYHEHLKFNCMMVYIKCNYCNSKVSKQRYDFHISTECPKQTRSCHYFQICYDKYIKNGLTNCIQTTDSSHVESQDKSQDKNKYLCNNILSRHDWTTKHRYLCPSSYIECSYCSKSYNRFQEKEHLELNHCNKYNDKKRNFDQLS